MDDVDVVLGYPWMDSIGTVNINLQKKFLKLWYRKKKITLQDISLSKQEEESTRKLFVAPTNTSDEYSMVESKKRLSKNMKKSPKKNMEMKKIVLKNMKKFPRKSIKMKKNLSSFLP